jgi:hypothetical protein
MESSVRGEEPQIVHTVKLSRLLKTQPLSADTEMNVDLKLVLKLLQIIQNHFIYLLCQLKYVFAWPESIIWLPWQLAWYVIESKAR